MYMPKIKDKSALIISILIPIAIGALSALFSNNMSSYATLVKPPLSPPSFIFPIVDNTFYTYGYFIIYSL